MEGDITPFEPDEPVLYGHEVPGYTEELVTQLVTQLYDAGYALIKLEPEALAGIERAKVEGKPYILEVVIEP